MPPDMDRSVTRGEAIGSARFRQSFPVIAVPSSRTLTRLQETRPEFTARFTNHAQFFIAISSFRPVRGIGNQSHNSEL